MLIATPKSVFGHNYDIRQNGRHLASVSLSHFRDRAEVSWSGQTLEVGREGFWSGRFFVSRNGRTLVTAVKPSAFAHRFEIECGRKRYTLESRSLFRRRFELEQRGSSMGLVRSPGAFSRKVVIELPNDLSIPLRIFVACLSIFMWRRRRRSN